MARETLKRALKLMFGHEGGYVNAATDAGGPTKYGITHKTLAAYRGVPSVSAAEVKALTLTEAEAIYRKNYWVQSGGDQLPIGLDYMAFDFGVNSGPNRAVKELQQVLQRAGVYTGKIDGWIGVGTIDGVNNYPGGLEALMKAYCEERMSFLRGLKGRQGFSANGRGWTIRVTGKDPKGQWKDQPGVIGHALAMMRESKVKLEPVAIPAEVAVQAETKATSESIGLPKILQNKEILTSAPAVITAIGGILSGNPVLQYGAVAVLIVGSLVGGYYFVRRIRMGG